MDSARREVLKEYFDKLDEPAAIVDKRLICVYSNCPDLVPVNSSVAELFLTDTPEDNRNDPKIKTAMIKGCFYSIRVTPLEDGAYYVYEFFNTAALIALAENTDICGSIFPIIESFEYNTGALWKDLRALKNMLENNEPGGVECAAEMEKRLYSISVCTKNIAEYSEMLRYTPRSNAVINLVPLAEAIVNQCNTLLSNTGRFVELVCVEKTLLINAEARHVLCAVVNAVQNALLYSTRECVPRLVIYKKNRPENGEAVQGEAVLKLVNDSAMYVDGSDTSGTNLFGQRPGYGIPIIKRFAKLAGGTFSLIQEREKFSLIIELPLVDEAAAKGAAGVLSANEFPYYQTDIPDILELKMREVIELFVS